MTYDIKKAVQRFQWRFTKDKDGNFKTFKPNETDVDAINSILQWMNRQKKISVNNNQLFAKLYIYELNLKIREHKTTAFCDIPQKELSKILDYPLHTFYESFHKDLIENQLFRLLGSEDKEEVIKEYEEQKELLTLEFVTDKLDDMISEALNRF